MSQNNHQLPALETLAGIINAHFPNAKGRIVFTPITTGKFNTSFFVDVGLEQVVLRLAPPRDAIFVFYEKDMMRQEQEVQGLVRARTDAPVAAVLAFDDSHNHIERDYILMERLPGRPWTEMPHVNQERVLAQMGQYLAQVHRIEADNYGYLGAHRPMEPQANWLDAFQVMWHKMIEDVAAVGYYDQEECVLLRRLLSDHLSLFDRHVPASLLHMDIWHQNILVDDAGTITGVVDWDRALWGDPEIEFAVLDYCGISRPAFWEGYGQPRDESPAAQVRQVFYLLYELQKYIVIYDGRNGEPGRARQKKQQVWDVVRRSFGRREK
jgi:aminoglycoside phosphotransferase (APT) family kinase protein